MEYNTILTNGKVSAIYAFAGYPEAIMFDKPENGKAVQHLIFGDYINLLPDKNQTAINETNEFVYVRGRNENGWIRKSLVQKERILEINFVDIGQGDGCHIVTPDDKIILIDAGMRENMFHFLSWRYNLRKAGNKITDVTAVITHPDADHYNGFSKIFKDERIEISTIYHNGIVERSDGKNSSMGDFITINKKKYLTNIVTGDAEMHKIIEDRKKRYTVSEKGNESALLYANMLFDASINGSNKGLKFSMLNDKLNYMPGYEKDKKLSIEILGPVIESDSEGKPMLKYFSDKGKTKNGHSIIFKLRIGELSVLLGGDLNIPAEDYLLNNYTGLSPDKIRKKLEQVHGNDERTNCRPKWKM